MSKKIGYNSAVYIKDGDMADTQGIVTLVASVNGVKRYYVERTDKTVNWYTFNQLKLIKKESA